ncbi:MAG TPA: hypothetical protein VGG62_16245 [Terracidiphilus sp.]|jgi:hypothetical protein
MAYERTEVPVTKSQEGIRRLIMSHKGQKIAFITEPSSEGFAAMVEIDGVPYQIKISGLCRSPGRNMSRTRAENFKVAEERRIWRVLFYHLKSVFEASDSGVLEFREIMLPYIVTSSGKMIAQEILPRIQEAIEQNPARLLTGVGG